MKFTNEQIYQIANELVMSFDNSDIYLPAKINFSIQKNMEIFVEAAQEIEKARLEVAKHYGTPNENGGYTISAENLEEANKEVIELFMLEQDLNIRTFTIEDLGDISFTSAQMHAMMCMIIED